VGDVLGVGLGDGGGGGGGGGTGIGAGAQSSDTTADEIEAVMNSGVPERYWTVAVARPE